MLGCFLLALCFRAESAESAESAEANWTIADYKDYYNDLQRSPELLAAIDRSLAGLSADSPLITRVNLLLWKLDVLVPLTDAGSASEFASGIFTAHQREDYASDKDFGDSMYQIVESLAKTSDQSVAYDVIQNLRESVYQKPSVYLNFTIDRCLIELAVENFDYRRALELTQAILNNPDYMAIEHVRERRAYLLNEITFLYNRLGDGERALDYVDQSLAAYQKKNLSPEQRIKVNAQASANRGRAFLLLGNYQQVEKMGLSALEGGKQLKQNYLIALGYRLIGSAAYNLGDYSKALSALGAGIELADAHGIETIKPALYKDYALTLQKTGRLEDARLWQQRYHEVSMRIQQSLSSTRSRLNEVELDALETHEQILELNAENKAQRERESRNKASMRLLKITTASLIAVAVFLVLLVYYVRKNHKNVVRQSKLIETASHELEMAAIHDPLTGLPNRIAVEDHLQSKIKTAQANDAQLTIAHLDLDHFKAINDKYGHPAGDYMLVQTANRMSEWAGPTDLAVRLGGDEFLVILGSDDASHEPIKNLQCLMDALNEPINFDGITLTTSVSMGVASFPEHSLAQEGLFVCSDLALYEAKQNGRNRICTFEPRLMEALNNRKALEDELILALQQDDIFPYFQPQLDITTGQIIGIEALVRWQHCTRGFMSPAEFLPVAESSGLMVQLGRHVMEKAIRDAAAWHKAQLHFGRLALNASANELHEHDFVEWLLATADRYGLPVDKLSVEVVETVIFDDPRHNVSDTLARLRASGLHVELDDFGTGYASLQQVQADDFDRIKIDRSFISNIDQESGKAAIVGSIVDMARKLGIDVVAEGAETNAEMKTLIDLGCSTVQGYGVARPMSATALREWFDLDLTFESILSSNAEGATDQLPADGQQQTSEAH